MGWANCGTDSKGRQIGYAHEATCDHPGCTEKIDRGLAYACGGMHGSDSYMCEGYFCPEHLTSVDLTGKVAGMTSATVCLECAALIEKGEEESEEGMGSMESLPTA